MSTTHPFRSSAAQITRVLVALRELLLVGDLAAIARSWTRSSAARAPAPKP